MVVARRMSFASLHWHATTEFTVLHAGAQRHLAAIVAADVAGYSRLIGLDEEGTVARLKATHREVIAPLIEEHRGRVVRTAGDGMLAELPSAVEAVHWCGAPSTFS
jgi:class 3 adenylate cyclase